jgi:hypothetical protein
MRQIVSGLVAAVAVVIVSAAPALACGGGLFGSCSPCGQTYSPCAAPVYVAPEPVVSTCGCGAAYERLPDPEQEYGTAPAVHQYYYADQGPTYTGPGDWAPRPTYRESAVYGYRPHHHYRPWYPRSSYYHAPRFHHYGAPHYGYAPHHAYMPRYAPESYHYGHRVLRRYY